MALGAKPLLRMDGMPLPSFISAGKSEFQPGERHVERIFPAFVAMFVVEGALYFAEDGREYELTEGQWFIQTPGLRHHGYRSHSAKTSFYWIHFLPEGAWEVAEDGGGTGTASGDPQIRTADSGDGIRIPRFEFTVPMRSSYFPVEEWRRQLEKLIDDYGRQQWVAAQGRFLRLLHEMRQLHTYRDVLPAHALADRIYDYLQSHYHESPTMERLSAEFHFSADYLTKCFRSRYGVPIAEALTRLRMEHAKRLLIGTRRQVRDIAGASGYQDLAVFSRAFKKYQGQAPHLYRKTVLAGGDPRKEGESDAQ
ncbi:helix-turn-helix transcriptional regulator [Cohnella cellulosilytica]|uniref:AraC family transcriptional regulator n=1 Tax=Cohnella cellulosilytica TaxID=986710 RepID=A0ABW2FIW4_9BACL